MKPQMRKILFFTKFSEVSVKTKSIVISNNLGETKSVWCDTCGTGTTSWYMCMNLKFYCKWLKITESILPLILQITNLHNMPFPTNVNFTFYPDIELRLVVIKWLFFVYIFVIPLLLLTIEFIDLLQFCA